MSDKTDRRIKVTWPGGEHDFAMDQAALRAVETATDIGPMALLHRIQGIGWRIDDAPSILRHGLIGAGMAPAAAKALVDRTCDRCAPADLIAPAIQVLGIGIFGRASDPGPANDAEVVLKEPADA